MKWAIDTNRPVYGQQFIGREEEVADLSQALFGAARRGGGVLYSLLGMNRIGKSSVVEQIKYLFDQNPVENTFFLKISLDGAKGFWWFWYQILKPIFRELEQERFSSGGLWEEYAENRDYFKRESVEKTLRIEPTDDFEDSIAKEKLEDLFSILQFAGFRFIITIDEFDKAGTVFGTSEENYGWFRSFLQNTSFSNISVLVVSRRSIYHIEHYNYGGSTLDGIFTKYALLGFNNRDIDYFIHELEDGFRPFSEEEKKTMWHYLGRSPYYWSLFGEALQLALSRNPESFSVNAQCHMLADKYEAIVSLLEEEHLLRSMLQAFVGPAYDLKAADLDRLSAMGYCVSRGALKERKLVELYSDYCDQTTCPAYVTVCDGLIEYMKENHQADIDEIWKALSATERKCRHLIESVFQREEGADWEEKLTQYIMDNAANKSFLSSNLEKHKEQIELATAEVQGIVGNSVLNVSSWVHLSGVLIGKWNWFRDCFSDFTYVSLSDATKLLYLARNMNAHINGELMTPTQIERVDQICEQMLRDMEAYSN